MVGFFVLRALRQFEALTYRPGGFVVSYPTSRNDETEAAKGAQHPSRTSTNIQLLLEQAIKQINNLGAEFSSDSEKLLSFKTRLEEGRFHLAVLGQFKRGKSTLLNCFLGEQLLPTSVVPLTAVPTFLEYGPDLRIRVHFQDERPTQEFQVKTVPEGTAILDGLVTEEGNPKNRLGIRLVEIQHPASMLRHGVVLIDTPGIGSTFTHNTEVTLNFLPQCDAALFVVSADPPLTEVEAEFLKAVKSGVDRLFFIFNKIDYLKDQERDEALTFFKKVLGEKIGIDEEYPIFCISARQGLDAKLVDDSRLWNLSGLDKVENHLVRFLASEKADALCHALSRKARDVIEDTLLKLRLAIKSLQMPLEDLERRLQEFGAELKNAERERIAAQDLIAGDKRRSQEFLEKNADDLRKRAASHLQGLVDESFNTIKESETAEQEILDGLAKEIAAFFQTSAEEITRSFGIHVSETLRPHQQRADHLIELVRRTAAQLFDINYYAPDSSEAFEMKRRPHWVLRNAVPTLPLVVPDHLLDRLFPEKMRLPRVKKRVARQVEILVNHNVENLRWAILQNLNDAFGRFAFTLDERFQETIAATHGSIEAVYEKRRGHTAAIADEVARFESAAAELAKTCSELQV